MVHEAGPDTSPSNTSIHVRRAQSGDAASTAWIIERFHPLLLAAARFRLGGALRRIASPEDLVAETWLAALPRLQTLGQPGERSTPVLVRFLSAVLFNRVRDLARQSWNRSRLVPAATPSEPALSEIANWTRGVLTKIGDDERTNAVHRAIAGLEAKDREVLVLRGIEGASWTDIEAVTGVSAKASAMRWSRALERLRKELPGSVFDELDAD